MFRFIALCECECPCGKVRSRGVGPLTAAQGSIRVDTRHSGSRHRPDLRSFRGHEGFLSPRCCGTSPACRRAERSVRRSARAVCVLAGRSRRSNCRTISSTKYQRERDRKKRARRAAFTSARRRRVGESCSNSLERRIRHVSGARAPRVDHQVTERLLRAGQGCRRRTRDGTRRSACTRLPCGCVMEEPFELSRAKR